ALDAGLLDAAVVAPFARVVHVGLTLFEEAAVTRERVQSARTGDIDHGLLLLRAGVTVDPFDVEPFLLEQTLVVGDQLGQTLERGGRSTHGPLHGTPPGSFSAVLHGRCPASYLTVAPRSSCPSGRAHRLDRATAGLLDLKSASRPVRKTRHQPRRVSSSAPLRRGSCSGDAIRTRCASGRDGN